ncbi:hypothetical protein NL676_000642 [Syzygium grande]|nr:hypothetical protein NL676_000642 [Syzygium grande]
MILKPDVGDFWALYYKFELQHRTKDTQKDVLMRSVTAEPKYGEKWQVILKVVENSHQPTKAISKKVVVALGKEEQTRRRRKSVCKRGEVETKNKDPFSKLKKMEQSEGAESLRLLLTPTECLLWGLCPLKNGMEAAATTGNICREGSSPVAMPSFRSARAVHIPGNCIEAPVCETKKRGKNLKRAWALLPTSRAAIVILGAPEITNQNAIGKTAMKLP